ncbi:MULTISPECIES: DUF4893 domain-containing protein [unclassified Sphingomonas]|uniref:DUF4893 domain-containing protein n=1 Tax=unclassified Sphingomonas TaxID=196159 RepID=UPI001AC238CF|nr:MULTISPECIES: DUF4893 domain-containing protein [unclassified Sphingomonas]MBN8848814.1 DUF4893 domain-containing protein [Sphingomonas sp.]
MVRRRVGMVIGLAGVALAGCAVHRTETRPHATVETNAPQPPWMQTATPAGLRALDTLDADFARTVRALPRTAAARAQAEGALLDPQAAQLAPQLPPGPYHCRLIRLGSARGMRAFPPDVCYVLADTGTLSFAKSTGENRPEGTLYDDGDKRMVLLGTWRRAGEKTQHRYGDDSGRDFVGLVERVSAFRWRLIIDRPGSGATLDVYEMVPVTPEVKGAKPMVPRD